MGRDYGQYCGLARALDVVGDRWNLLIVRQLLVGPARYRELRAGLAGIATNLLADRLRDLESAGVVERTLADDGGAITYALTPWGAELREPIEGLIRWSTPLMVRGPEGDEFRAEWLLLALPALFAGRASTASVTVGIAVDGDERDGSGANHPGRHRRRCARRPRLRRGSACRSVDSPRAVDGPPDPRRCRRSHLLRGQQGRPARHLRSAFGISVLTTAARVFFGLCRCDTSTHTRSVDAGMRRWTTSAVRAPARRQSRLAVISPSFDSNRASGFPPHSRCRPQAFDCDQKSGCGAVALSLRSAVMRASFSAARVRRRRGIFRARCAEGGGALAGGGRSAVAVSQCGKYSLLVG